MEHMRVFKENYLVYGLPEQAIGEISALAECGRELADEYLIKKGDRSGDLFVILDGTVSIYTPGGEKLADAGPGSVIGEMALVDDQPRSADVICKGLVTYAKLPAKELRGYMASKREVGFIMLANLSRVLSMRLRSATQVVGDLQAKARDPWQYSN